jgi:cytochrome c oxidase cbb3-type subunit 3
MSANDKSAVVHVYDGIEELDNHLPNWWLFLLWLTVLFAFGYWYYYQTTGEGRGTLEVYRAEAAEAARLAEARKPKPDSDAGLLLASQDKPTVDEGLQTYQATCAACHGQKGEGLIGPNLTDNAWLHGAQPTAIHKVVSEGVLAKGMPNWEKMLGPQKVRSVVAYVLTLKNTNVPGKAPQGEPAQ